MLSQTFIRAARPAVRSFSTTARAMAGGDVGAPPRTGGQGDAFQKREKANEDYTIKQREKEKLMALKKRLSDQQKHLKELSDSIDELTREQGGEHK